MKIRVLLGVKEDIVREALRCVIGSSRDMIVAGEAATGSELVGRAQATQPDVAVVEAALPGMATTELVWQMMQVCKHLRVLILSNCPDLDCQAEYRLAGASGFFHKGKPGAELLYAIRRLNLGNEFFVQRDKAGSPVIVVRAGKGRSSLTDREMDVVRLIAAGATNKKVGCCLGISVKTVEKHRQSAMRKAAVCETAGLTRFALRRGLVQAQF